MIVSSWWLICCDWMDIIHMIVGHCVLLWLSHLDCLIVCDCSLEATFFGMLVHCITYGATLFGGVAPTCHVWLSLTGLTLARATDRGLVPAIKVLDSWCKIYQTVSLTLARGALTTLPLLWTLCVWAQRRFVSLAQIHYWAKGRGINCVLLSQRAGFYDLYKGSYRSETVGLWTSFYDRY